jgi:t-SNARE complex subunit (syntaxin)
MRRTALPGPIPGGASSPARPRKVVSPSEYHPLAQGQSHAQNTQISYAPQTLDIESQQEQSTNTYYYQARNAAIQGIESTINELSSVYQQLAHMVMHQGEMIQRIDQNLDEMQSNVRKGQKQLERFLRNLSSHQWLMIKIFAFIILFIIVYCLLLR